MQFFLLKRTRKVSLTTGCLFNVLGFIPRDLIDIKSGQAYNTLRRVYYVVNTLLYFFKIGV